jgi:uncharacterized protein YceH (UPF0502 family)
MHLLCGEVNIDEMAGAREFTEASIPSSEFEALRAEQKRLANEVSQLRALVQRMAAELGMPIDDPAHD